jgi:hypothetical protein
LSLPAQTSAEAPTSTAFKTFRGYGDCIGFDNACIVALAIHRDASLQCQSARFDLDNVVDSGVRAEDDLQRTLGSINGHSVSLNGLNRAIETATAEPEITPSGAAKSTTSESSAAGSTETASLTSELLAQLLQVFRCCVARLETRSKIGQGFRIELPLGCLSLSLGS